MALLLDTHAYLWFINDDPRLSLAAAKRLVNPVERVVVSVVSAWEIVIKSATGKLVLPRPLTELWPKSLAENRFEALNVSVDHVFSLSGLRLYHRDPFDRILVAQALAERLQIVSADPAFDAYPVQRIW